MRQVPEAAEPVIYGHHDQPVSGQVRPVEHWKGTSPYLKRTAVQPNQHRQPIAGSLRHRPYVQEQAIFALLLGTKGADGVGASVSLNAARPEAGRRTRTQPWQNGTGRSPAHQPDRRGSIPNAAEDADSS